MAANVISPEDIARGVVDGVLPVYKEYGETPLECLERLRNISQFGDALKYAKLSYAGRLDPLAEGLMIVLVGEENKNRHSHLGLGKTYELDVLFDFSTDTGDLLGLVTDLVANPMRVVLQANHNFNPGPDLDSNSSWSKGISVEEIKSILPRLLGEHSFSYPAFSSRTVGGKPLFEWAKGGKLDEIEIPKAKSKIISAELLGIFTLTDEAILNKALRAASLVKGNFRQESIVASWHDAILKNSSRREHALVSLKIECSSGTYMRTLAEYIGSLVGKEALAYRILRTRVGDVSLSDAFRP